MRKLKKYTEGLVHEISLGMEADIKSSKKQKEKPIYPDVASNPLALDVWKRKNASVKKPESNMEAGTLHRLVEKIVDSKKDLYNLEAVNALKKHNDNRRRNIKMRKTTKGGKQQFLKKEHILFNNVVNGDNEDRAQNKKHNKGQKSTHREG